MNSYIEKERDWGNIEYKIAFIDMTLQKIKKYATQLKYRVIEGSGTAIYMLGVKDNGQIAGIAKNRVEYTKNTMTKICNEVECKLDEIVEISLNQNRSLVIFKVIALFSLDNIMFIDT